MPTTTLDRYRAALTRIAGGDSQPQDIAHEALRDRRPAAKPKIRPPGYKSMQQRHDEWIANGLAMFEAWHDAGHPAMRAYARKIGLHPSALARRLETGSRALLHPTRKGHRLHMFAVWYRWGGDPGRRGPWHPRWSPPPYETEF